MNLRTTCTWSITGALWLMIAGCGSDSPPAKTGGTAGSAPTASSGTGTSSAEGTDAAGPAGTEVATTRTGGAAADSPGATAASAAPDRSKTMGGVAPARSDTLLFGYRNDPDSINPLTANDNVSREFQMWVYDTLADQKYPDPDVLTPGLAESWTFDEPSLTFTIKLRKGVKWHPAKLPNGKPLPTREFTAKDVKFTFDCILNPNSKAASWRSYFTDPDAKEASERIKVKVTVVDDYLVKIKWTKPYFLADEFTLGIPIIPRHVYSVDKEGEPISFDFMSEEFAEGFNNHWANSLMCGTGPMMFREWTKDQRVVLERNTSYWGEPFYFSRVIFKAISNPNTARENVLNNEMDWFIIPDKNLFFEGKENENVKNGKVVPVDYDYPAYRMIAYNQKREFLKDKKVRWALSHATPVQNIIDVVLKGLARRTTGPMLFGSRGYDSSIPPVPYDLEMAAKLLTEAGWEDTDGSGTRSKTVNGQKLAARFDLMIYADSPTYLTVAEIIKENCRKVGVDVQISPAKWNLMIPKLHQKEFDAAMLGWNMGWKQDLFQIWHSSQADVPESSNSIGYANPELDKLIEEMRVTFDPAKQIEISFRMHRLIYDDQPYTFLYTDKQTAFHDARLENIKFYKIRPGYDVREWFSSKPRELTN